MAFAQTIEPAAFDMGRVVTRTFSTVWRNLGTYTLLLLSAFVPALIVGGVGVVQVIGKTGVAAYLAAAPAMGLAVLLYFAGDLVVQAGIVYGSVAHLNGRRASYGECVVTGLKNFFPLFLIAVLVGLGFFAGLILLVVPGFIVLVAWSVAFPAQVVERAGIGGSLGRSWHLTSGHRWAIFGLLIGYGVFTMIVSAVPIIGGLVVLVFLPVIRCAGLASIYYELRVIKEGIGPEALASVFD